MSNEIQSFLDASNVIVGLEANCKRGLLKTLSEHAAKRFHLDETALLDSLLEREHLGSTGIGHGVAIPHARADLPKLTGIMARLAKPIDFDAIDDRPIDIVFLLVAPEKADGDHLKALSRITRLVRDASVQKAMRGASDVETLYAIATGERDAKAA